MNCQVAIVDDEPVARDILRKYIADIPGLVLAAECRDAFEATRILAEKKIDILLLDINLPRLSGISFARSVSAPPLIIFTTAYPEFAVEGFELDAADYLVKPFSFERFFRAVNKALDRLQSKDTEVKRPKQILLKADKKLYAVNPADILYVEGVGDYIKVVTEEKNLLVHNTLSGFTEELSDLPLVRIHRSFSVNPFRMDFIEGNRISVSGRELPISRDLRDEVIRNLGKIRG